MEQIWAKVIKAMAVFGGAVAGALGGWDAILMVLVTAMVVDYVNGIIVAALGRSQKTEYGGLSSKVGFIGLAKKGLMLMVVLLGTMLDKALGMGAAVCRDAVCWFYIANEGLSIVENLNLIGLPFPRKIKDLLGDKLEESNGSDVDKPPED